MLEKFKNRKKENLFLLLVLLIITLVLMNRILSDDKQEIKENKITGSTLAKEVSSTPIEDRLENMIGKIDGVGEISILLTYNEEELEGAIVVASRCTVILKQGLK
ncbi:MAG: hypothetical protein IKM97_03410 [Clostridia bacterium]|nr:hypothetical protein [Clostridia bacterium]